MAFFNSAVGVLQTLVVALGAGLGIWGAINLLEGYGNDNPGAKSQGMKQLMAGGGVALIGITVVPLLSGLFDQSEVKLLAGAVNLARLRKLPAYIPLGYFIKEYVTNTALKIWGYYPLLVAPFPFL